MLLDPRCKADYFYLHFVVVGAEEERTRTVNIRNRDDPSTQKHGALIPLETALQRLIALRDDKRLKNEIPMGE